ncbi:response regulator transcription factor [Frondihabitans sp. VKM Ac-2883]|uniref:response regulator transcription factor n=1 Tax=Frondihabitans sp. VKM Ac-2883 TaxID=2783823 RepID=UPI00188CAD89|nr:response regulator transcription factor [Frondihabitans sp. VKM Ac-2883]MBF4574798.1 response regulator transcription factor [Frondihabitans sp. VKM Ac-2883]
MPYPSVSSPALPPSSPSQAPASTQRSVLVVEDDPVIADVVVSYLVSNGHAGRLAVDGLAAVEAVRETPPDLVLLDRMLPGIDGLEACRRIRLLTDVPIIMLTALGQEHDRISGLEAGADDYLVKPFSPRELMLRVEAVLRRTSSPEEPPTTIVAGRFRLDRARREIAVDGRPVSLTAREYDLLAHLITHPDRVFRRDELLRSVWDWELGDLSTVTVHVRRLREKIEEDPSSPANLLTVWGVGYRFTPGTARS